MGLTIDLPSAGLLGISGAQAFEIDQNTTMNINSIYVCKNAGSPYTITLPTTIPVDGGEVLVKNVGTQTVTVAAADIEGTNQSITITNNQPVRFVYINATFGWLIT
jgi:hypothetical protein|tara:strand:- start:476 stop:793 length:318 start_codon:yes stop_codon:yes gene_type:complete